MADKNIDWRMSPVNVPQMQLLYCIRIQRSAIAVHLPCRYIHYVSKLPGSREAFEEQLAQFYGKHGATLVPPSILQIPLDCYVVFNAVAERGGFEGVSGTRYTELTTSVGADGGGGGRRGGVPTGDLP